MTDVELRRIAESATPGPYVQSQKAPKRFDTIEGEIGINWCGSPGSTIGEKAKAMARYFSALPPATVISLLDRLANAETDAARYRHWRDRMFTLDTGHRSAGQIDALIDAERSRT
jgi:hypothetical protein